MNHRLRVGIIGATGMVGQNYVRMLENHRWFEVTYLAASPRSAGTCYGESVAGRRHIEQRIPEAAARLRVHDAAEIPVAGRDCDLVFSAISLDKDATRALEDAYAAAGFPVISNNSAHRTTPDVPMMIPEVNGRHAALIPMQQKARGWRRGFIVTKPNCGIQSYTIPIAAMLAAGLSIERVITTNLQALSGAGYPGVASLDVTDNLAHLPSEEEKALVEPAKILGSIAGEQIAPRERFTVSSHCIRVPVVHGHSSTVSFAVEGAGPEPEEIVRILRDFRAEPQELSLPSAPDPVIHVTTEPLRPQPRWDREAGGGMAVSVGRVARCPVLGYRMFCLSHNTIRGAAGGAILTAELLAAKGFIESDGLAVRG